jgi:hypothetical protein
MKKEAEKKYYKRNLLIKTRSRLPMVDRLIISDIDHTLIGDADGLKNFLQALKIGPGRNEYIACFFYIRTVNSIVKENRNDGTGQYEY